MYVFFEKNVVRFFYDPNSIHHIHSHRHRTSICAVPTTVSYFNSGSRFRGSETLKISVRTSKQTWYLTYNSIQQLQLPSPSYVKNIFPLLSLGFELWLFHSMMIVIDKVNSTGSQDDRWQWWLRWWWRWWLRYETPHD